MNCPLSKKKTLFHYLFKLIINFLSFQKKTDGEIKITPLLKANTESEEEYVVERIVSRRYNIRKKAYEYFLKWEGYSEYVLFLVFFLTH